MDCHRPQEGYLPKTDAVIPGSHYYVSLSLEVYEELSRVRPHDWQ